MHRCIYTSASTLPVVLCTSASIFHQGARPSTAILNTLLSPVCGKSFTWSVCWAHCKHARCSADHGQSVSCKAILDPRLCQVTAHPNQSTSQLSKPLRLSASQELAPIQNEQHQAAVPKVERLDMLPAAVTSVGVDESDATDRQQDAHSLHQLTQPAVGPLTAVQKTDSIVLKALADQHAHQEQQQQQQQQQLLQEPLQQLQPELAQHEQLQQLASEQLQSEHLQQQQQQHAIRGPRGGQELPDAYDEHDPTGQQVEQQEADSLSSLSPSLQLDIPGFHACLASDASSYHPMHHHCQQGQSDQGHELHALLALPPNAPPQELALPVADADAGQINIKADSSPAKDQRQSHQHQQQQLGLSIALADATEHTTEAGSGCALAEDEQLRCLQQRADGTIVRQASADVMVDIVQDTILETQLADCAADDNAAAAGAGSMVLDELELQKALQALPAVNAAVLSDGHDAPQHVYQQQGHGMLSEDPHSVSHDFEQPHQQHHQQQQQSPTVSDRGAKSTQQHDSAGVSSRPEASKASQQEQQSRQGTELDQAGIDQPQEHLAGGPAQADTADRVVTKQHHPTSDAVPDESAAMASDTEQQQASEQPPQQLPLLNSAQHAPSHSVPHSNNPQHAPSHSLLHSNSAQHAPSHSVPQHSGGSEQYPSVSASKQETSVQHLANCSPAEYRNSVPQQAAADAERSQLDEQGPMQQSTASTEQPSATVSETVAITASFAIVCASTPSIHGLHASCACHFCTSLVHVTCCTTVSSISC